MGRWRELWDDLLGRGHAVLRESLRLQLTACLAIADLLLEAIEDHSLPDVDLERVRQLEEEANEALKDVFDRLSRTLSTPIDREDLFRLSRSLDDVVDNLRDFAVEAVSYRVADQTRFVVPLQALRTGCEGMSKAVDRLNDDAQELADAARYAKHENTARDAFHDQMAKLLAEDLTMATIRDRELLRRLDVAGLRLGEAADILASGALKRR